MSDDLADGNVVAVALLVTNESPTSGDDAYQVSHDHTLLVAAAGVLVDDSDADDDPLSAVLASGPAHGTLQLSADGGFSYIPDAGFVGTDSFTYRATDGLADSPLASVTIDVVNFAPVAADDAYTVNHDRTLSVAQPGPLANDGDADDDPFVAALVADAAHGTLDLQSDGTFNYTPDAGYVGTDSFTYRLNDGRADGNVATVTIDVVNTAPWAVSDAFHVLPDGTLDVDAPGLLANDADAQADTMTVSLAADARHGTLTLAADGSFTYVPAAGFVGIDFFRYEVSDGLATSRVALVRIDVATNSPAQPAADEYAVLEDGELAIDAPQGLLANDLDADGNLLTVELAAGPEHGVLRLAADGSFVYAPAADFHGTDTFRYRVDDGRSISAEATVTITVGPLNDAPRAAADAYSLLEAGELVVLAADGVLDNDVDVEGSALTAVLHAGPSHGVLALAADGGFTYTPQAGFIGVDRFSYRATDGGLLSAPTTVSLTVQPLNRAPIGQDDTYRVGEDSALTVSAQKGVLVNDRDPLGDPLTASLIVGPAHGSLTLANDGSFVYTPDADYFGADGFTYRASDGALNSADVEVTILVQAVADHPVGADDQYDVAEDATLAVAAAAGVLANDHDEDGDALRAVLLAGPTHGTLVLGADGSFTYSPNADFAGADSFRYAVSDGGRRSDPVVVAIAVQASADAPLAEDDAYRVTEDGVLTVTAAAGVLANDGDADGDALAAELIAPPSHGALALAADGSFDYTPAADYAGEDSFTYRAGDGGLYSTVRTVSFVVVPFNDTLASAVVAAPATGEKWEADAAIGEEDSGALDVDLYRVHLEVGQLLTADVDALRLDAGGARSALDARLRLFDAAGEELAGNDDAADPDTGRTSGDPALRYLAEASGDYFVGVSSAANFDYDPQTAGSGAAGPTGAYRLQLSRNTAPAATADAYAVDEDLVLEVTAAAGVLANDGDAEGDPLHVVLATAPQHGALTLHADGSFSYVPHADFHGQDTFTYRVSDGLLEGIETTVGLTVASVDDAPRSNPDGYAAHAGQSLVIAAAAGVLANDADPDGQTLTAELVAAPVRGTLTLHADGSFDYAPDAGELGADSFSYRAFDGAQYGAVVSVALRLVNAAPEAARDRYTVAVDGTLTVAAGSGLLANDLDADNDVLEAVLVSAPWHGDLALDEDGSFVYTTDAGFSGTDYFDYVALDPFGTGQIATVAVHVTAAEIVAYDDAYSVRHGLTLTVPAAAGVLAADWDRDSDPLTVSLLSGPSTGQMTLAADGSFTYVPVATFAGTVTFVYEVDDGEGHSATATATIEVVNHVPEAVADAYRTTHDQPLVRTAAQGVLANDHDADADVLTVVLVSGTAHGALAIAADGSFTYTPDAGYTGQDSFTYRAVDAVATSANVTVAITVANAAPVATADRFATLHDTVLSLPASRGVLANDLDADGDDLTAAVTSGPAHGALSLAADGGLTYTPQALYVGEDSFAYRVWDGASWSAPVTVAVEVRNAAPSVVDASYVVHQGDLLAVDALEGLLSGAGDGDDDVLSAVLVEAPQHGLLDLAADGSFSYTPDPGYTGIDTFTYKTDDGPAESAIATATILVQNRAPLPAADHFAVLHDQELDIDAAGGVLSNDVDFDGDVLLAALEVDVSHGVLELAEDGSFTYTPVAGFVGTDSFTYTLSDGAQASDPVTVLLDVTNFAPQAAADLYYFRHDQVLAASAAEGALSNDFDADASDVLAAELVAGPEYGDVVLAADGSFAYTPDAGFVGFDAFTYRATDGIAESAVIRVSLFVANSTPAGTADFYDALHDRALVVGAAEGVLANDVDLDADETLTATLAATTVHGTLVLHADGSFVYTPEAGYLGEDFFSYRVGDGAADGVISHMHLQVVNNAPIAVGDPFTLAEDGVLVANVGVLANDSDPDLDALSLSLVAGPAYGTLTLAANGTFTYAPEADFAGIDWFEYQVSDGLATSAAIVSLFVVSVNDAPAAPPQSFEVHAGRALTADLLGEVEDVDFDWLEAVLLSGPTHGTIDLDPTGLFVYTPAAGYVGQDAFSYAVADGTAQSAAAVVTIQVTNQAPQASARQFTIFAGGSLDVPASQGLAALSSDADGDDRTASLAAGPSHGTLTLAADGAFQYAADAGYVGADGFSYTVSDGLAASNVATVSLTVTNLALIARGDVYDVLHGRELEADAARGLLRDDVHATGAPLTAVLDTGPAHGTLTLAADGSFSYAPDAGFVGEDSFTYRASDGTVSSAPAVVVVRVANHAPVAGDETYTVLHGEMLTVPNSRGLLVDDYDVDGDVLTVELVAGPTHGSLSLALGGGFTYEAAPTASGADYVGLDSFTYRVFDGAAYSGTVLVEIEVTNHVPTGSPNAYRVHHGQTLTAGAAVGVLMDDFDFDADEITAELESTTSHGSLAFNADGSFSYTPDELAAGQDFVGGDGFSYRLFDGAGYSAAIGVSLLVWNNVPSPNDDFFVIQHGTTLSIPFASLLSNDVEWDGDSLVVEVVADAAHGTLAAGPEGFSYTPGIYAGGRHFVGNESFSYVVYDGAQRGGPATVTIAVRNHAPVGVEDYYEAQHGQAIAGCVLDNDWDFDGDEITAVLVVGPAPANSFSFFSDGTFNYVPLENFAGVVTARYAVRDSAGDLSDETEVTLHVLNRPPHAVDDVFFTGPAPSFNGNVATNDLPFDGDVLNYSLVAPAAALTTNPDGSVTYSVSQHSSITFYTNGSFTYSDSEGDISSITFRYNVTDGVAVDEGQATVHVLGSIMHSLDDHFQAPTGGSIAGNVLTNDIAKRATAGETPGTEDIPAGQLEVTLVDGPDVGHFSDALDTDGSFTYAAPVGFTGRATFTYRLTHGPWTSDATVVIYVGGSAPAGGDDAYSIAEDAAIALHITAAGLISNDGIGPAGFAQEPVSIARAPRQGSLAATGPGGWDYRPDPNFHGADSFTYIVTDALGAKSSEILVSVTVTPTNDATLAVNDEAVVNEDGEVTIDVLANDTNIDGTIGEVFLMIVSEPDHGTAEVIGNLIKYTPHPNYHGPDTFTYSVIDADYGSAPAGVVVYVTSINDVPLVSSRFVTVAEGQPATFGVVGAGDLDDNAAIDLGPFTPIYFEIKVGPQHGTARRSSGSEITYTPAPGFSGGDSITLTLYDADWTPVDVVVSITVTPVNQGPVARADVVDATEATGDYVIVAVLANDTDDGPLSNLEITSVGDHAEAMADGTVKVTRPGEGVRFVETEYTISDGQGGTSTAAIYVDFGATEVEAPPGMSDPVPPAEGYSGSHLLSIPSLGAMLEVSGPRWTFGKSGNKITVTALEDGGFSVKITGENAVGGAWSSGGHSISSLSFAASGDVDGISLSGATLTVVAGKNITGALSAATITARAALDIHEVTASANIGEVWAGRDLLGVISSSQSIGTAFAGNDLAANVTATNTLFSLAVNHDLKSGVTVSAQNIANVAVGHDLLGKIEANGLFAAGHGHIGRFEAPTPPSGGVGVGNELRGEIKASGHIARIWATMIAQGESAAAATIDAGGRIYEVLAGGDIAAKVRAQGDVVRVHAGGNFSGSVTSAAGNVGRPVAGTLDFDYGMQPMPGTLPLLISGLWRPFSTAVAPTLPSGTARPGVLANGAIAVAADGGISAALDVGEVWAGVDINAGITAEAGTIHLVSADNAANVTLEAATDVLTVKTETGDLAGTITADGRIGAVSAGRDLLATLDAGTELTGAGALRDVSALIKAQYDIKSLGAGRDLLAGSLGLSGWTSSEIVSTAGSILEVSAGRDLTANLKAHANVGDASTDGAVDVGRTLNGDITAENGYVHLVRVGITPPWNNLSTAAGSIAGATISAKLHVGDISVTAAPGYGGGIVGAKISSQTDGVGEILASGTIDATISAYTTIAKIAAGGVNGGDIAGKIDAKYGSIGAISALRGPAGTGGSISAAIHAGGDAADVDAELDITGAIDAAGKIGAVAAGRDISGDLLANGGAIAGITAERDILSAQIKAHSGIPGGIAAGRNLGGAETKIETVAGGLGHVVAGTRGGGNIDAAFSIVGGIDSLVAYGQVPSSVVSDADSPGKGTVPGLTISNVVEAIMADADPSPTPLRRLQHILEGAPLGATGNIKGSIAAGRIGKITAYRDITANIVAVTIGNIWALGDVKADIAQILGQLTVTSWGTIEKSLTGAQGVQALAYGELKAQILGGYGTVDAASWSSVTGDLGAYGDVGVWAHQDVKSGIVSIAGSVTAIAWQKLSNDVVAFEDIVGVSNSIEDSHWYSSTVAVAYTPHDIRNVQLSGVYVYAYAGGDIEGLSVTAVDTDVIAGGHLTGSDITTFGGPLALLAYFQWFYSDPDHLLPDDGSIAAESKKNVAVAIAKATGKAIESLPADAANAGRKLADKLAAAPEAIEQVLDSMGALGDQAADLMERFRRDPEGVRADLEQFIADKREELETMGAEALESLGRTKDAILATLSSLEKMLDLLDGAAESIIDKLFGWANIVVLEEVDITASVGGILSITAADVAGTLNAKDANIVAWGNVSASLTTERDATLDVYGVTSGSISAAGIVQLHSFGDVTGSVAGHWAVGMETWGNVTGSVASAAGPVVVEAYGNIEADLSAGSFLSVVAWGNIQAAAGAVGADGQPRVQQLGAGGYADILAAGSFNGSVTAAGDVAVEAWQGVSGAIRGGTAPPEWGNGEVSVISLAGVSGSISSSGHVSIAAHQSVAATVASTLGEVVITTLAEVTGSATAAQGVVVLALGSVTGTFTATAADSGVSIQTRQSTDVAIHAGSGASIAADQRAKASVTLATAGGAIDVSGLAAGSAEASVDVTVAAAGASLDVFSGGDAKVAASAEGAQSVSSVSITAFGAIQGTVTAANEIAAFAWGSIEDFTATTTAAASQIEVTAIQGLNGTYSSGGSLFAVSLAGMEGSYAAGQTPSMPGGGASLVAHGGATNLTVDSAGSASVQAGGAVQGQFTAGGAVTLLAGQSLSGEIDADGDVVADALYGSASLQVHAGGSASVIATQDIAGSIAAGETLVTADAVVHSLYSVQASISAPRDVSASAHLDFSGFIDAGRDAQVLANRFQGTVLAGHDAFILSATGVTGNVVAGADVSVSALEDISAVVSAGANADLVSVKNVSSIVGAGSASLLAGGEFTGNVATVYGASLTALGQVSGQISAGGNASVVTWKDLTGAVSAGLDASVVVEGNVSAPVSAGRDADVLAHGNLAAAVTAGQDARVLVHGTRDALVTAGRTADVLSVGAGTADVVAGLNATVGAWSTLSGNVTAVAGDASVFSSGALTVSVAAGDDADLQGYDRVDVDVAAGGRVEIFALDKLNVQATAGADAQISTLKSGQVEVQAGTNASVSAADFLQVAGEAGLHLDVSSFGGLTVDIAAGGNASVFTLGSLSASIEAGEVAEVTAFGPAMGIAVGGGSYASVFASGHVSGEIASARGSVDVFSAASVGANVWAADVASVGALDTVFAIVSAGTNASVSAGASVFAAVTSGWNASVTSGWLLGLVASAGGTLEVQSIGDAVVAADAAYDIWLAGYADVAVEIEAGRDVPVLWARGDLVGVAHAAEKITHVKSYGAIDLDLAATHIYRVTAWGDIDGAFEAEVSIGEVRSAAEVSAVLVAPTVGLVVEHDRSLLGAYPQTPEMGVAAARAAVADALRSLLAAREALLAQRVGAGEMLAAILAEVASTVEPLLGDPAAAAAVIRDAEAQVIGLLARARDADFRGLDLARVDLQAALDRMTALAARHQALDLHALQLRADAGAALAGDLQAAAGWRTAAAAWERTGKAAEHAANADGYATGKELWPDEFVEKSSLMMHRLVAVANMLLDFVQVTLDIVGLIPFVGDAVDAVNGLIYLARGRYVDAALSGVAALSFLGVGYAANAARWGGRAIDAGWTIGRKLASHVDEAAAGARTVGNLRRAAGEVSLACEVGNKLRRWHVGDPVLRFLKIDKCFVAGTLGVMEIVDGNLVAIEGKSASGTAEDWDWLQTVALVGVGVVGWRVLTRHEEKKAMQKSATVKPRDRLFTAIGEGDEDGLDALPKPVEFIPDDSAVLRSAWSSWEHESWTALESIGSAATAACVGAATRQVDKRGPARHAGRHHSATAARKGTAMREGTTGNKRTAEVAARGGLRRFAGRVWLAVFLLAACGWGWWSQSDEGSTRAAANAAVAAALGEETPLLRTKPIEDIRLGERMEGRNPHREEVEGLEPDEATWRHVRLEMRKHDGLRLWIELLRPLDWVEEVGAEPGATVDLDLPEMGASGPALVTYLGPCLPIEPDDRRRRPVVTGTFEHETDGHNVVALRIEGQAEPTGVTDNHRYWSVDRNDFVEVRDLKPGELVDTPFGPRRVESVEPLAYTGHLYNLETSEHVYRVDGLGTLVHNAYAKSTFTLPKTWRSAKGVSGVFSDGRHSFRIDTHNLGRGERFHVHIYDPMGIEIAVIQGKGTNGVWRVKHEGEILKKPTELSRALVRDIRRLMRHALRKLK